MKRQSQSALVKEERALNSQEEGKSDRLWCHVIGYG